MTQSTLADRGRKKRLTLGFLTYHEDNNNQIKIMGGVFGAARKYDVNIIQFCAFGRSLGESGLHREIKTLLQNINQQNLDGLMFVGWIPNFEKGLLDDFQQLPMPLFSIGTGYENIPNVHTDGGKYLRELFIHLISVHGCRRIAFVSPAIPSVVMDNRIGVYNEVMNQYGIYHPELFVSAEEVRPANADFYLRSRYALNLLLHERKTNFDAIFSAYNEETIGLLNELNQRGIHVPRDVKVVGYEDDDTTKYASVPVTTFYFPFWELGYYGCQNFINLLQKAEHNAPFSGFVPGKIIYRNSCGCISETVKSAGDCPTLSIMALPSGGLDPLRLREEIHQTHQNPAFCIDKLLDAFFNDFTTKTKEHFFPALEEELAAYFHSQADAAGLENFISGMRRLILPAFGPPSPMQPQTDYMWADNLLHQARIVIQEKMANMMGRERVEKDYLNQKLHRISQNLITTFNTQKLMDVLESSLPEINIPGCYIFLFREQELMNNASLVFQYTDNRRIPLEPNPCLSQQGLFFYLAEKGHFSLLAYPLSVKNEYLGLVFFEPGPMDERIYYTLSVLLSTALKEALLVERLENTNQELKAAQEELVDKAHKAGMADIATGTLHNIGNVLNSINTSIYVMKDMVRDSPYHDFERANQILKERMGDLENFIIQDPRGKKLLQFYLKLEQPFHELQNLLGEHLERLVERINLVNEIITAQQDYAGVKSIVEELDITDIIKVALKLLSAMLQKYKITVVTKFQPVSKLLLQRTKLLHILINLFNNARDAMMETPDHQRILAIVLSQVTDTVQLRITDTGHGIPADLLTSIFALGFTTRQEGHGFGLHSCANYMAEIGGEIWAESPGTGKGSTFVLQFTINKTTMDDKN